jgi:hypothetical protein
MSGRGSAVARRHAVAFLGMIAFALVAAVAVLIPPAEPILHTHTVAEPPAVCNEHDGLVECPPGVTWPPDMPPYEVSGDRPATPRTRTNSGP